MSLVTYSFILFHSSVGRVGIIVNAINNFLIGGQGAMWNIRERYSPWKRGRASDGGRYLRYMGGLCFVDYHRYHATWRHHGVAFLPPPWFVPLPLLHSSPEIKHLGTGACIKGSLSTNSRWQIIPSLWNIEMEIFPKLDIRNWIREIAKKKKRNNRSILSFEPFESSMDSSNFSIKSR